MKKILFMVMVGLLSAGNVWADNSRFFGIYTFDYTACGQPDLYFGTTIEFGNDASRQNSSYYFYMPLDGTSWTYKGSDDEGETTVTKTISGNTISYYEEASTWTIYWEITMSADYNSYSLEGTVTDDYPDGCNGPATGIGTRLCTCVELAKARNGDLDGDGDTDARDLSAFAGRFGR